MNFMETMAEKWRVLCEKAEPAVAAVGRFFSKVWDILLLIWSYIMKFRKIFLAIPVVWVAIKLAFRNMALLPATVGLNLQVDGTFATQIPRDLAVWSPVILTIVCLLLMFSSKRVLTPWLVSVISLIVPIFIWITNVFPS